LPRTQVKSDGELRRFSLIMALGFGILGGLLIWRARPAGPYVAGLAALFLLSGLAWPRALAPVERGWMAFSRVLSVISTYVILTIMFFLVITPIGLLLRLVGKDLLQTRLDRKKESYWVAVDPEGPCSRPDKPY
jgi:hypothetical protein